MKRVPVKNLSHLKKLLQKGAKYRAIYHRIHPDYVGLVREVDSVQSNAVYSKIVGQPEHNLSVCNHNRGIRTEFEKASQYIFGDTVKVLDKLSNEVAYEFEVLSDG